MAAPEEFSLLCPILRTMGLSDEGWSRNPGRYMGVAEADGDAVDFRDHMEQAEKLTEELETPHAGARELEQRNAGNEAKILEG